jgi:hypothetical protein
MVDIHGLRLQSTKFYGFVGHRTHVKLGPRQLGVPIVGDSVVEYRAESIDKGARDIHRQVRLANDIKTSQVVGTEYMIGMQVRVEHRVEMIDIGPEALQAELRRRIDNDTHIVLLDANAAAHSRVMWVSGRAYVAVTGDLWNAKAGRGAEERDDHGDRVTGSWVLQVASHYYP